MTERSYKQKFTLTVGIPSFNEEANISFLLKDIADQELGDLVLEKIIVNSDGSSDKTVEKAESSGLANLLVIDNHERQGQAARENEMIAMSESDILILLSADIALPDKDYFAVLCEPLISWGADLAVSRLGAVAPKTFTEKALETALLFKQRAFAAYNNGSNIYTCAGAARAFSRRFYKILSFPASIGEDAYSYLSCQKNNFKYAYVPDRQAYIKLPDNIKDHERQSLRFLCNKKVFYKIFGREFTDRAFYLPAKYFFFSLFYYLIKRPIGMLSYLFIYAFTRAKSLLGNEISDTWEISESSKDLGRG